MLDSMKRERLSASECDVCNVKRGFFVLRLLRSLCIGTSCSIMLSPCRLPFEKARRAARFSFHVERVRDIRLHGKQQSFAFKSNSTVRRGCLVCFHGGQKRHTCIESEETNVAWESILATTSRVTNFRLVLPSDAQRSCIDRTCGRLVSTIQGIVRVETFSNLIASKFRYRSIGISESRVNEKINEKFERLTIRKLYAPRNRVFVRNVGNVPRV